MKSWFYCENNRENVDFLKKHGFEVHCYDNRFTHREIIEFEIQNKVLKFFEERHFTDLPRKFLTPQEIKLIILKYKLSK